MHFEEQSNHKSIPFSSICPSKFQPKSSSLPVFHKTLVGQNCQYLTTFLLPGRCARCGLVLRGEPPEVGPVVSASRQTLVMAQPGGAVGRFFILFSKLENRIISSHHFFAVSWVSMLFQFYLSGQVQLIKDELLVQSKHPTSFFFF